MNNLGVGKGNIFLPVIVCILETIDVLENDGD
jgi:hypothetical protein